MKSFRGKIVMARFLFVAIVFLSAVYISNASKCGPDGPEVLSPFHLINQYPRDVALGHPGYELKCSGESSVTVISFPTYGELLVKSIDYETKRIDLIDPKSCVHRVFLDLDLTNTPFRHFYYLKDYTYLNCSSSTPVDPILSPYHEIPCMSGDGHKVYTVDVSIGVPDNCRAIKTVAIPFGYSPYISDNTFGLALTWDSLTFNPMADHQVLGWGISSIFVCAIALAGLIVVKMYKKQRDHNNKEMMMNQGIEQLLKDTEDQLQSEEEA